LIPQARSRFGPSVHGALSCQKGSYFLDESSKRRPVFRDQTIAAPQRDETGTAAAPIRARGRSQRKRDRYDHGDAEGQ
jgi:hypothetical protein